MVMCRSYPADEPTENLSLSTAPKKTRKQKKNKKKGQKKLFPEQN
jgi:hypothetical protein